MRLHFNLGLEVKRFLDQDLRLGINDLDVIAVLEVREDEVVAFKETEANDSVLEVETIALLERDFLLRISVCEHRELSDPSVREESSFRGLLES